MRDLLSSRDISEINSESDRIRRTFSRLHRFFVVYETKTETTSGTIDTIFGEPVNAFSTSGFTVSESLVEFSASIIGDEQDAKYLTPGLNSTRSLTIEVSSDTVKRQKIVWKAGVKVRVDAVDYRLVNVDDRGMIDRNRIILNLDKVT